MVPWVCQTFNAGVQPLTLSRVGSPTIVYMRTILVDLFLFNPTYSSEVITFRLKWTNVTPSTLDVLNPPYSMYHFVGVTFETAKGGRPYTRMTRCLTSKRQKKCSPKIDVCPCICEKKYGITTVTHWISFASS